MALGGIAPHQKQKEAALPLLLVAIINGGGRGGDYQSTYWQLRQQYSLQ